MALFVNCSNHPVSRWSSDQLETAQNIGDVIDVSFPNVPASASAEEVANMAQELADTIASSNPAAVMLQGEMTLVFKTVSLLKERGITCLAACSERKVVETTTPDGETVKTAVFQFSQFRAY